MKTDPATGPTPTQGPSSRSLTTAKRAKNDEFYTQWADIEREMNAYLEYDPDVFHGKTILLPCDDHHWSQFWAFFNDRFEQLGLTRLVATGYATGGRGVFAERTGGRTTTDLLDGDGDFRSPEVTALRDEADLVITNPPFSLFREFIAWLIEGDVQFSVIGNPNAITYKEVFPLIKDNKIWLGQPVPRGSLWFGLAAGAESEISKMAATCFRYENGQPQGRAQARWFTNIDHGRRHDPLQLMTEADNIRFSKHKNVRGVGYQTYDNYDAIEVTRVDAIPSDYPGAMGVPVTFLDKYNPDQFEILGLDRYVSDNPRPGHRFHIAGREIYARILIKHRNPQVAAS